MQFKVLAAIAALSTLVVTTAAEARREPRNDQSENSQSAGDAPWMRLGRPAKISADADRDDERPRHRRQASSRRSSSSDDGDSSGSERHTGVGPRPGAWCGWYMRTRLGGGPEYNLAANWRHWGSPGSPQVGAIVVWDHHVGEIVGRADNGQWIVLSGNDGGAVRRRPRSISGASVRV